MFVNCAVCDQEMEEREAFARIDDDGEVFHVCSSRCLEDFEEEPELFGAWAPEEGEIAEAG